MAKYVSIRRSLVTRLIGLVLITTGALIGIAVFGARQAADDVASEFVDAEAGAIGEQARKLFELVELRTLVVRDWVESGRIRTTEFEDLNSLFLPVLLRQPSLSSMMIADSSGASYMLLRDPVNHHIVINRFVDPNHLGGRPVTRVWNRLTGEITDSLGDLDYDVRSRIWFQGAVDQAADSTHWTPPVIFYTTRDPGMTASIKVTPDGDLPAHVVAFDVLLLDISTFTANARVGDNGAAFVVVEHPDDRFRVVGLPRQAGHRDLVDVREVFRSLSGDDAVADTEAQLPLPGDFDFPPMQSSLETWIALGRKNASFKFEHHKANWWAHVDRLKLGDQTLLVGVVEPEADFLAEAKQDILIISLVGVFGILAALGMAVKMSRSYSDPLESLVSSSRRIRDLDLSQSGDVRTRLLEVHQLDQEQNVMRIALESFSKYVPVTLVRELIHQNEAARIGGENRVITVMFTDVEGFTTVSEQLKPEEIAHHMSEYFDVLLSTVEEHGGEVIQMLGDGIMAFWGAPRFDDGHALKAVEAALDFNHRLTGLNEAWLKGGELPLPTRFGINTGEVMVGNMGSRSRLTYAAIGDDVNLASRIEGINKYYGTRMMASGETRLRVGDSIAWRQIDTVRVKGKAHPIDLSEPLGHVANIDEPSLRFAESYERALRAYQQRQFEDALVILAELLEQNPKDGPSIRLKKLSLEYQVTPPAEDWDGVTNFEVK